MARCARALALLCLLIASCGHARGPRAWKVVRSPGFELYTDGSEATAVERLQTLEQFRHFIIAYTSASLPEDLPRFRVIAPERFEDYEALRAGENVLGYYQTSQRGAVAVFSLEGAALIDAAEIALHEYVHHVQFQGGDPTVPSWYREGLAEYLRSFEIEGEKIQVGRPLPLRVQCLQQLKRFTDQRSNFAELMKSKFGVVTFVPAGYAQAWLLVHYLVNEEREALADYLARYAKDPAGDHFRAAFGVEPEVLGRRAYAYLSRSKLPISVFRTSPVPAGRFEARPISAERRDELLGSIAIAHLPLERIEARTASIAAGHLAQLPRAEALLGAKRVDEALAVMDAFLAARPDAPPRAHSLRALIRLEQALGLEAEDPRRAEGLADALKSAITANRADANDVIAFEVVARVGEAGGPVSEESVLASLETAQVLAPHRRDLRLVEARYRAARGDEQGARAIAAALARVSDKPKLVERAQGLLASLDGAETATAAARSEVSPSP